MFEIPETYNDLSALLNQDRFSVSTTWYHGTSSGLTESILETGLMGSGDRAMTQSIQDTMTTIGNKSFTSSEEPIYLTPSKALAYYWAVKKTTTRNQRFGLDEVPALIQVDLSEAQNKQVRPDVGAKAFLLLQDGEAYLNMMFSIYEQCGKVMPDVDLMKLEREQFVSVLGLAYCEQHISVEHLSLI